MKSNLLVLAGALVGGIVGHVVAVWMARQGFYAIVLPGGMAGLGAAMFRSRSVAVAIVCGIWGLFAGLVTEYHLRQFIADPSFGYFLTHIGSLQPVSLLLLIAGALIAFWMPFSRGR